jgi:UDP-N-acetylglucosamine acyltransferase
MDGARIGKNCRIFPGAVIAAIPQDLKFDGEKTTVEIGDHVTIRECVTINRGTNDRMTTRVGEYTLIMAYVHLAHDCLVGSHCIIANAVNMAGHVVVGDHAVIGGMSAVHQFVHIGAHVMISGGSLVRKDVPPYVKAGREPLSYAGINSIGLRRRGYSNEAITAIQDIYRILYVSGLNTTDALARIEAEMPATSERDEIILFIQNAKRGIMRGYGKDE